MSTISPRSLLSLTVDSVARNYRQLCERLDVGSGHSLLVFKNDYFLPANICELLLKRFFLHQDDNYLADFLTLFTDPNRCPLKRFFMGGVNHRCLHDMRDDKSHAFFQNILKMIIEGQNLLELDLGSLCNSELVETDFSRSNSAATLKRLIMVLDEQHESGDFPSLFPIPANTCVSFITNFTNLKHLSLNNCANISDNEVAILASKMNHLESLDLSSTNVSVINVFDNLTTKLKVLIIHNTPLAYSDPTNFFQFSNLHHLDISRNVNSNNIELCKFFNSGKSLQFLRSLDISGAGTLDSDALQGFLENHRKLCFLGLLDTHYLLSKAALDHLEVTGDETFEQVLACLSHYRNRPLYLTKVLKKMFTFSQLDSLKENVELRKNIIETLLDLMRKYMDKDKEDLQTAASACLYHYVRHDTDKEPNSLHVSILSDMVAVLIEVLRKYPKVEQIQRNCLVVLYNKYILSATKFDAYQMSDLLFKATMLIPEGNVTGIALDMCAYLSSKISVEETLKLGTRENIEKLLSIISTQVDGARVNSLLLCSLRVLWNLTDEAPQTCHLVLNYDGLPLAFRALQTFDNKPEVLTKLLGVMNNLAEVVTIRPALMCDELVSCLRKYLDMNYAIDVSYFSAGTLCNLILDWPDGFHLNSGAQSDLLFSVGSAVNRWKKIDTVMVGYRTFKSFLPLLRSPFPDVQLWAIWAIHHVCSQKVERYGQLCRDEGVVDLLQTRTASGNRSDVKDLAVQALDAILKS